MYDALHSTEQVDWRREGTFVTLELGRFVTGRDEVRDLVDETEIPNAADVVVLDIRSNIGLAPSAAHELVKFAFSEMGAHELVVVPPGRKDQEPDRQYPGRNGTTQFHRLHTMVPVKERDKKRVTFLKREGVHSTALIEGSPIFSAILAKVES